MDIKVKYNSEVSIKSQKNGTVFSGGGDKLWVKQSDTSLIEIGTGEIIPFNYDCFAKIIISIEAKA
jgi:hypothetical protein